MKFLFATLIVFLVFAEKDSLTGRWESKPSEKGNVTGVVFKAGGVMEAYINKKPFVSASYTFKQEDSLLSFADNGCNGTRAVYKVLFYNNSDSLRFHLVADSCEERRKGMERLIMGRVK
jgi:hypothetical protein